MSIENYNYWEHRAQEYLGQIEVMTSNDPILANLEIEALDSYFATQPQYQNILEVGCGSGRIIKTLADQYPLKSWHGIDYSETMIQQAVSLCIPNSVFEVANMLTWNTSSKYDQIFFVRSLTNLASHLEQTVVLDHMQSFVKSSGALILLEPTLQGMEQINRMRTQFDLEPMKAAWFNHYLDLPIIIKQLEYQFKQVEVRQFSATYCLVSRVINAAQAKHQKEELKYSDYLNQVGASMDQTISNVSTHVMIIATR